MSIQELLTEARHRPQEMFLGLCVFLLAVSGAAVKDVASVVFLIFVLTSLFYARQFPQTWKSLCWMEKLFLSGFLLYMVSGFLSYVNTTDDYEYVKQMGRYIRFAAIVPVYLFLVHTRLDLTRFFIAGVVISGPVYLLFAMVAVYHYNSPVGQGYYHHILFGDAAMLNALLMLAFLITKEFTLLRKGIIAVCMLSAFYAAILSTSRGAWLAAPVVIVTLLWYARKKQYINAWSLVIVIAVTASVITMSPARDIISKRYDEAVNEVRLFKSGENIATSVGMRLAMWDIAMDVWKDSPVLGTGPGDYDDDLIQRKNQGRYATIANHNTTHNIYLQVLASNGLVGVLVLVPTLIIFPLIYISRAADNKRQLEKLASLVLIISVAIFGLTESWTLRAPFIAIYAVYFVVLVTNIEQRREANVRRD